MAGDKPLGAGTLTPAELDKQADKVYRLFKRGNSKVSICRALGMSMDVVERRLARARKNLGEDSLADMRADRESSLTDMIREAHKNLDNAETVAERNACVRTIADLNMKVAKLLGLEVPAKVTLEMEKALELLHFQGEPGWGDE
ncbi:hypothetical protein PV729_07710 [Streptomyces europaeiscabiei]|uniref:RNA polymerase sigma factor 70 region 4 type 2 domain-containing protein n=1 Tax=Streptomyces europaeiscabiei TaxID=146819 RepID=A0ABU4NAU6_9ACTN|nr:hypothetical protein [Streptomyces europaeiscabiei]MDX3541316.1 hypothetical protein [Streptomyces europaeiscabiei]MDX3551657.1 hypothetical protein [Streptomyces europaeiscabiei]MDX3699896.1 hypothetical protein [Streptomyces europaeiscabiei]